MLSKLTRRAMLGVMTMAVLSLASCKPKAQDENRAAEIDGSDPLYELGVSWQLAQYRATTLSALRYDYRLKLSKALDTRIEGEALISFRFDSTAAGERPVVLDFLNPEARTLRLEVNGQPASWFPINDHLVIPSAGMQDGENSMRLSFIAGDEALNRNREFLYTLFVPDRAHFSLPVFDQPNLKGEVAWDIEAPSNWVVVANGPLLTQSEGAGVASAETIQHRFARSKPLPSYLFAFAAGQFLKESAIVDGREMVMYHRESDTEKVAANRDEIFALHGQALAWLEDYTQIDYPFAKFDFVAVPSFQYGGMEHPGSVLYRESSLFLDATATQNQILSRASLIAHETAHMWFGDLVTMNWFDDVWTKEVYANFMAAKIVNPAFPEIDHELRFHTAHHPSAYAVDRTAGANAIGQPLENLRFAGSLYGAIIYQKAPIVMRHLEQRIGEEALRDGLRDYLRNNAYGNATWPGLIALLDSRSEQDLSAWNEAWVYESGRPRIIVERQSQTGGGFTVRQEDPAGLGRVWPQRLQLLVGEATALEPQIIDLGSEPVVIEGSADLLLPNGSGVEYGDFVLDSQSLTLLLAEIGKVENSVARGAAWTSLWEQVSEGRLSAEDFLATALRELPSEPDELIVSRVLRVFDEIYWQRLDRPARIDITPALESLLWTESNTEQRTLSSRAAFYRCYRALATSEQGVERLARLWRGEEEVAGLPLSETDQVALVSGLVLRGIADPESLLDEQESRIRNADRLERFRFVRPSLSASGEARSAAFYAFTKAENRQREPWVLESLRNIHHPLRQESSIEFVRPALDLLPEIQATGDIFFPGRWLDAVVGRYSSPAAAQAVRDYIQQTPELSPRLVQKLLQSADVLLRLQDIEQ